MGPREGRGQGSSARRGEIKALAFLRVAADVTLTPMNTTRAFFQAKHPGAPGSSRRCLPHGPRPAPHGCPRSAVTASARRSHGCSGRVLHDRRCATWTVHRTPWRRSARRLHASLSPDRPRRGGCDCDHGVAGEPEATGGYAYRCRREHAVLGVTRPRPALSRDVWLPVAGVGRGMCS